MKGFITKNSIYCMDTEQKLITGGKLGKTLSYTNASVIVGQRARILLADGKTLVTSEVKKYL